MYFIDGHGNRFEVGEVTYKELIFAAIEELEKDIVGEIDLTIQDTRWALNDNKYIQAQVAHMRAANLLQTLTLLTKDTDIETLEKILDDFSYTLSKDEYIVSGDKLKELLIAKIKLAILEGDGVDNWEWYMEGYGEHLRELVEEFGLPDNTTEEDVDIYDIVPEIISQLFIKIE